MHNLRVINHHAPTSRPRLPRTCRPHPARPARAPDAQRRAHRGRAHRPCRHLATGGVQAPRRAQGGRVGAGPPRRPRDSLQRSPRGICSAVRLAELLLRVLGRPVCPARRPAQEDGPMTAPETRTLVMEKELPHPPEKVWRALTKASLLDEWLLKNDFQPVVGHKFTFRNQPVAGWDGGINCEVLAVEPRRRLSYPWGSLGGGRGAARSR